MSTLRKLKFVDDCNTDYNFEKKSHSKKDYNSTVCQQTSVLHRVITAARLSALHAMARAVVLHIQHMAQLNGELDH